jgi:molecular chaperone DnaK (HSP70)
VLVKVYEGRRKILTRENILLGQFILSGIGPAERGIPRIEITFDIDCNSILTVTASDEFTWKNKISLQINGKNTRVMESPLSNAEEMQLVPFVPKSEPTSPIEEAPPSSVRSHQ